MGQKKLSCFRCEKEWSFTPPLGRAAECPECGADARVCRNCQFFDTSAHKQCRESQAELVQDKDRANFCGYFSPNAIRADGAPSELDESRQGLASLFGDDSLLNENKPAANTSLDQQFDDFFKKNKS